MTPSENAATRPQPKDVGPDTSPYRTVGLLAQGGMGRVELCVRVEGTFQRVFAVKRLKPEHLADSTYRTMFLDEARIAGLLRHPNVVSVLDVGTDHRGPYLAMDFIPSINASELIKWAARHEFMLPVPLVTRIVRQATAGLRAAHELLAHDGTPLQLIHRDISPQNILLGFDGLVRVADFGIAKANGRAMQTTTGLLKGKSGYMSPEQLRFEDPSQRSDLFSLGVVFFELLSARRLYKGKDSVAVARRILSEPVPDIFSHRNDVPESLVELLFELLAKDPDDRPESAARLLERLDTALLNITEHEAPVTVERFLSEQFSDRQARDRQRLAELLDKTPPTANSAVDSTPEAEDPPSQLVTVPDATPSQFDHGSAPRRRRWVWALATASIGLAIVLVWFGVRGSGPPPQESAAPTTPTRTISRREVSGRPRSAATPDPLPPAVAPASTNPASPPPVAAAVAPPQKKSRSVQFRRRKSRVRPRPARLAAPRPDHRPIMAVDHLVEF